MDNFDIKKNPFTLIILDGWGIAPAWGGNAISLAKTKNFNTLSKKYPTTSLLASGSAVGLPTNAPGNSEAGHLNIGAGRVARQDTTIIDQKIEQPDFKENKVLKGALDHCRRNNSSLHLLGLLSKVGIHSNIHHLYALLNFCKGEGFSRVYIHLFSDGRDSGPMDSIELIQEVENEIKMIGVGRIVSIMGRYFAMDRDNRWGRIARAYNLLTKGEGNKYESVNEAISNAYSSGQTDEFIEPRLIAGREKEIVTIKENDSMIVFNCRGDRIREIIRSFLDQNITQFSDRKILNNIFLATFVLYDDYPLAKRVFAPEVISSPLAKVFSDGGLRQFHVAETEKYPHVTFFINGGVEKPFQNEMRQMVPSPKIRSYDHFPEMSAKAVTDKVISALSTPSINCIIVNFANPDMVGHSGNLNATTKAVEFVDNCLGRIITKISERGGIAVIVGDHGNAEEMVNPNTGEPDTEHSTNPVPFILFSDHLTHKNIKLQSDGILSNVTPTILDILNIEKPAEMLNKSLIINTDYAK